MSKHTPGPWVVDRTVALGAYGVWYMPTDDAKDNIHVCTVMAHRGVPTMVNQEMRNANCALIAAAPEMLDVLRVCADRLADDGRNWRQGGDEELALRIRNLIAEATGGTP